MRGKDVLVVTIKFEEHKKIITHSDCNCKYEQNVEQVWEE
jgi:hypothetical protein